MESKKIQAVLSSLAFFEIFHCSLTRSEIFNYLLFDNSNVIPGRLKVDPDISQNEASSIFEFSWTDFNAILDDLLKQGVIINNNGLYSLNDDNQSVDSLFVRWQYQATFHAKYKKAKRWVFFMSIFPGVRAIAAVNSVGFKLPTEGADIDFLIITDDRSLYISRLMITLFLKVFGLRPTKSKQKDKICTSFWLSEKALNLEKIAYSDNDVYLYYWLLHVYPLYDQGNYWEKWQSANFWLKSRLPNSYFNANIKKVKLPFWGRAWKVLGEIMFNNRFFNQLAKKIQYSFFSKEIKEMMNKDTRVIVSDEMLKFHTVDNRQKYFDLYQENLKNSLNKYQYVAKEN